MRDRENSIGNEFSDSQYPVKRGHVRVLPFRNNRMTF